MDRFIHDNNNADDGEDDDYGDNNTTDAMPVSVVLC